MKESLFNLGMSISKYAFMGFAEHTARNKAACVPRGFLEGTSKAMADTFMTEVASFMVCNDLASGGIPSSFQND